MNPYVPYVTFALEVPEIVDVDGPFSSIRMIIYGCV